MRGSGYALHRPYMIASRRATILQLHKYLAMRLGTTTNHRFCIFVHAQKKADGNSAPEYADVPLANNETLDGIERKYWRSVGRRRNEVLVLTYTIAISQYVKPSLLPVPSATPRATSPVPGAAASSSAPISSRVITINTDVGDNTNGPSSPTSVAIDVFTFFSSSTAVFDSTTQAAVTALLTPQAAMAQFIPAVAPTAAMAAPVPMPWQHQSTIVSPPTMHVSPSHMSSLSKLASLPSATQ